MYLNNGNSSLCSGEKIDLASAKPHRYRIPCTLMRGGTSRGPFFLAEDLPAEVVDRDRFLLRAMGSPQFQRVDGIAGMDPTTSKLAIISKSARPDADVDYLFAQADLKSSRLDYSANCGNMLSAVGPFAIERGLVEAKEGETLVRVHNLNTHTLVHVRVATSSGRVEYSGDFAIDGVPGTGSPIYLDFLNAVGSKTGKLLPSGLAREEIEGIAVSLFDVAVPMVMIKAEDLGFKGCEIPGAFNSNPELLAKIERIRLKAGLRMGLGDCSDKVVPKVCLVSEPKEQGVITSRYFTPKLCHPSHAVTGALCLAVAAKIPGTVAHEVARGISSEKRQSIVIEHPSGSLAVDLEIDGQGEEVTITRAAFTRTADLLFEGSVFVTDTQKKN
jgi:2-methylaconitate cis-trans-isomerase PrpF